MTGEDTIDVGIRGSKIFDPGIPPTLEVQPCKITVDAKVLQTLPMVPVTIRVNGSQTIVLNALVDTAAEELFISDLVCSKYNLTLDSAKVRKKVVMADGSSRISDMKFKTKLKIGSVFNSSGEFYSMYLPHADMILSCDWMHRNKFHIDVEHRAVYANFRKKKIQLPLLIPHARPAGAEAQVQVCQLLSCTETVRDISRATRSGMRYICIKYMCQQRRIMLGLKQQNDS